MPSFDPQKDLLNQRNHGISLSAAEHFDWETALIEEDRDEAYGEYRGRAIGCIGDRLFVYVYTTRGDEERAISLRHATRQEIRHYGENI
ncbi:BrnT family toxin [Labrys monachus]|uniref:Uncharacterized DUF497 family protein n=1 Tax=Labrys monachus TaxID=217067 RepID=A0ABU0FFH7_9HYPH|nr:BrnT family toxin [Labrys monachus]MDQ0392894.1 uncharacterized DUF497 family protein [Labrys monachus]